MIGRRTGRSAKMLTLLVSVIVFVFSLFLGLPLLFAAGAVAPADVILHLAIDARMHGDEYVAELYQKGVARKVICASSQASWDVFPSDYSRDHLLELGLPAEDVSVQHLPMTECGAEVMPHLIEHLKSRGVKSVLLVVGPTLTRYADWRTRSRFRAAGIDSRITFSPEDRRAVFEGWWHTHWKAQHIVSTLMNSSFDLLYASCR